MQVYPYIIVWEEPIWLMAVKLVINNESLMKLNLEDAKFLLRQFKKLDVGVEIEFSMSDGVSALTFRGLDGEVLMEDGKETRVVSSQTLRDMISKLEESISMRKDALSE